MIKELKVEQIKNPLVDAIAGAYFIKGMGKPTGSDLKDIVDYVSKTLKESFTTYRIPEVCQSIELGARGELFKENDLNTISPENIFKWIHRFNETIKREAIHKQKQYEEKLAKESEETYRQAKINTFESLIKGKYIGFPDSLKNDNYGTMASYYRYLDKNGFINISIDKKKQFLAEAEKIKEEDKNAYTTKEIAQANALKFIFDLWQFEDYELNFKQNAHEKEI